MKKKSRKIIIGSLLAVCMLMMTPMISAMQFNNIKETIKVNHIDNHPELDYEQLKENIQDQIKYSVNDPKFPILLRLVVILAISRNVRSIILNVLAGAHFGPQMAILYNHPLLGMRSEFLLASIIYWLYFWMELAEKNDWQWPDLYELVF